MISYGHDKDPIVMAIVKATGLKAEQITKIVLLSEAQCITKLRVEYQVTEDATEEIANTLATFELVRKDD